MEVSFLTYNTLFNNGFDNIDKIISLNRPDIICFQEAETREENLRKMTKYGYKLAGYENSFIRLGSIYGVATFYDDKVFKTINAPPIMKKNYTISSLFYNLLSTLLGYGRQKSFLLTNLIHLKTNKKITVCNTHLFVIG